MQITNVLEYLENTVKRVPDKTAYANENMEMTFGEVYHDSRAIGSYLANNNYYKEPVVVFMKKHPHAITAFYGCVYGGCYYVPIDDEMPEFRIRLIFENLHPRVMICDDTTINAVEKFDYNGEILLYDHVRKNEISDEQLLGIRDRQLDTDPIYIVFTSGSTGVPKGVVACHRSVIDYIENLSEVLRFNENTRFANQTPLYFDACLKELYPTLKFGATTYIVPKSLFMFPIKLVEFLNEYKINTVCWVVSALTMISAFKTFNKIKPEYLHTIAFGSEVFPIKQLKIWRETLPKARFVNLYGPTEATGMCCYFEVDREFELDEVVPIGRPFHTFQTMGYIIDVYRGKQSVEKNFFKLALFVSFFPQLVQGPISRFHDLSETLFSKHYFESNVVVSGLMRILWGYFKKVVIADRIITGVTTLIHSPSEYQGAYVFIAMLFYAFELYCDFTGGIDITIGIAEVMGIRVTENFNLPYFSKNIKEYWNRWHITMGTWFTDYIFYPISVCKPMLNLSKFSRKHFGEVIGKRVTVYLSAFVVWFTTGLWHGAAWNFIVWGLMNFVVIMVSQELEPLYEKFHKRFSVKGKVPYEAFQILRTFLLMSCIRMFDCYRDVPLTFKMVGTMFTKFNIGELFNGSLLSIGLSVADYVVLIVGFIVVFTMSLFKVRVGNVRTVLLQKPPIVYFGIMAVMIMLIIVFGAYGIGYDSSQFIYNQF